MSVANVKCEARLKPKSFARTKSADGISAFGQNIGMNKELPTKPDNNHNKEGRLADHILPSSATMIGVCMTVISLAHLIPKQSISKHVNEMLAFDSLLFLSSALLSYFSLRHHKKAGKFERMADVIFLVAISLMVVVGFVVSFELMID